MATLGLAAHEISRSVSQAFEPRLQRSSRRSSRNLSKNAGKPPCGEIWSFFSGGMGLDLGLEQAGLAPTLAVERDENCCATIRLNRPALTLLQADVATLTAEDLQKARTSSNDVFLMVGGPPCQSFSSGGKRAGLKDPRGNLIYEYLRLVGEVRPRFFVMENVANLITSAIDHRPIAERPGKQWNLRAYGTATAKSEEGVEQMRPEEMSGSAIRQILKDVRTLGYTMSFGVLNAAEYGAPQHRLRFVLLGSREHPAIPIPNPTHGDPTVATRPFSTLRDAIFDLRELPGPHSEYTDPVRRFFEIVPPGGYWKHLPPALQREALGPSFFAGGGKTGFFRRLSYERPSPTVTTKMNRKGSAMCHPEFVRPLSVKECARLQGFPDEWQFVGAMNQQYLQIGNAVPTHLGQAIGKAVLSRASLAQEGASAKPAQGVIEFEQMLEVASRKLRAAARNTVGRKTPDLFDAA